MFLRKSTLRADPLPVAMSGVRMGERVLQIGVGDPRLACTIASKAGLSGEAAIVASGDRAAERARAAAANCGVFVNVQVAPLRTLPFADGAFDVIIVHTADGFLAALERDARSAALAECHRVLRAGGRLVTLERGSSTGLAGLFRAAPKADTPYQAAGGTVVALETVGFRPVRQLADREGYRFVEGLKT